jgi:hypothetical protein
MSQTTQLDEIRSLLESQEWFRYNDKESLLENLKWALCIPPLPPKTEVGTHIDEFIDYGWTHNEKNDKRAIQSKYARFVLLFARMPAVMQYDFEAFSNKYELFCTYESERYKVVGGSRMGDIWLTKDPKSDSYQLRVSLDKCSDWSNTMVYENCTIEQTYKK